MNIEIIDENREESCGQCGCTHASAYELGRGDERTETAHEIARLRQGLWDCALAAGIDGDGNKTPDALAHPDIVEFALRSVGELRADYGESLTSSSLLELERRVADAACNRRSAEIKSNLTATALRLLVLKEDAVVELLLAARQSQSDIGGLVVNWKQRR